MLQCLDATPAIQVPDLHGMNIMTLMLVTSRKCKALEDWEFKIFP